MWEGIFHITPLVLTSLFPKIKISSLEPAKKAFNGKKGAPFLSGVPYKYCYCALLRFQQIIPLSARMAAQVVALPGVGATGIAHCRFPIMI